MEPHREEQNKAPEPSAERKPKRFRIVKLEERIAPKKGGRGTNNSCACGTVDVPTCPDGGGTDTCATCCCAEGGTNY
jgi:hypothetical protein